MTAALSEPVRPRTRGLSAAALVVGLLLFLGLGHGLHGAVEHDRGGLDLVTAVCFVLATLAVAAVVSSPVARCSVSARPARRLAQLPEPEAAVGARVSPAWLQRFRR